MTRHNRYTLDDIEKVDFKLVLEPTDHVKDTLKTVFASNSSINSAKTAETPAPSSIDENKRQIWKIVNKDWFWDQICPKTPKNWLAKKLIPHFILKRVKSEWYQEDNLYKHNTFFDTLSNKYKNLDNFHNLSPEELRIILKAHDYIISGDKDYISQISKDFYSFNTNLGPVSDQNPILLARGQFLFNIENLKQARKTGLIDALGFAWEYVKDKATIAKDKVKNLFGEYGIYVGAAFAIALVAVVTTLVVLGKSNLGMKILKGTFYAAASIGATILFAGFLDLAFDILVFGAFGLVIGAVLAGAITLGKHLYYKHIKPKLTGKPFEPAPAIDLEASKSNERINTT